MADQMISCRSAPPVATNWPVVDAAMQRIVEVWWMMGLQEVDLVEGLGGEVERSLMGRRRVGFCIFGVGIFE